MKNGQPFRSYRRRISKKPRESTILTGPRKRLWLVRVRQTRLIGTARSHRSNDLS
ncbi:MAG: hypothetical protein MI923_08670 [Phycisphaerales bacterium]|nr:hypothetical protein [Phycisphaerales bacterium]